MSIKFDAHFEARSILKHHTFAMMYCTNDYYPKDNDELQEYMLSECAYILTENFIDGRYTPMEYNDIRNELAEMIYSLFVPEHKNKACVPYNDGNN